MSQAQLVFEAIQRSKGQTDFSKTSTGKYTNQAIQTRWNYFINGLGNGAGDGMNHIEAMKQALEAMSWHRFSMAEGILRTAIEAAEKEQKQKEDHGAA